MGNLSLSHQEIGFSNEERAYRYMKEKKIKKNIVNVHCVEREQFCGGIFMDVYDCDLLNKIEAKPFREQKCKRLFYQLCKVIKNLHSHGIAHMDIKPENVLMKGNKPYLADFGASCLGIQPNESQLMLLLGTSEYMPPEVHRDQLSRVLPFAIDIYSLGILLHVCMT